MARFRSTAEQKDVISHAGSAFIAACPGSGKTRVLVERARRLLADRSLKRGIAVLSFTTAAVSELEQRLRREALLGPRVFPHFIGTFDSFLWQFLIAPFGVPGCSTSPRLIPDKDGWLVRPYRKAQGLPLGHFSRKTGEASKTARAQFKGRNIERHETAARNLRERFLGRGELDFSEAREIALARLRNPVSSPVLKRALAARFKELIVDEAQDCDPNDLQIIDWFRIAGIPVMVICDPHQSIYGFRGGVTQELLDFGKTFAAQDRLPMTGNFRSSRHIARAITALRVSAAREGSDEALGDNRDEPTPIYVLGYRGKGVPATVGVKFEELTTALDLNPVECPIVAPTRHSGAKALGHPIAESGGGLSCRLAAAVSDYYFSFEIGDRKKALEAVHKIMLEAIGGIADKTYHQHIEEAGLQPGSWRPRVLSLIHALRYDPVRFATVDAWLDRARELLAPSLPPGGLTIKQRLPSSAKLDKTLSSAPPSGHSARTIHSVKGMQFPAVCVVISPSIAKSILDSLTTEECAADNENVRKVYVGASRAERLLAIAVPNSQAQRLQRLLETNGSAVSLIEV